MSRVVDTLEYERSRLSRHSDEDGPPVVILPNGEPEFAEEMDLEEPSEYLDTFDAELVDDLRKDLIRSTPSKFISFSVQIQDPVKKQMVPFSFSERRYLIDIYDTPAKRVLLKCGRQIEKSTTIANKGMAYSCMIPGFRTLYVSPSNTQTKQFSQDRLKEPLLISPRLRAWTTAELMDNVFQKQFINRSSWILRYAFLNADRCLAGSSRIQLVDGRSVRVDKLAEQGASINIISALEDGSPIVAKADRPRQTGHRDVARLRTAYPVPLDLTLDHEVLTGQGWKLVQDLQEGDFVAAPHYGHLLRERSVGEDWAWLLGAMVAEGSCVDPRNVSFCNSDEEFILEFVERAGRVGIKLGKLLPDRRYDNIVWEVNLYSDNRGPGLDGGKLKLWEIGEFGERSHEKHLPSCIFQAPIEEKAAFLWALFNGDGWCTEERGYGRAGYGTSSRQLMEDLVHLLWGLGIRTSFRVRPPSTPNAQPSFSMDMSAYSTTLLVSLIGAYRGGLDYRKQANKDNKDRIPVSYEWLRQYLKDTYGLSTHSAWKDHRIQLRPGNRRDSIGRRVLRDISKKLDDDLLRKLAAPDKSWVEVKEVEFLGEQPVYNMDVEGPECLLANGLVVHNCRGIPADMVDVDEMQSILLENLPVIEECASHSAFKYFCYSGTPLSLDNPMEYWWQNFSTQCEWMVPCDRCGSGTGGAAGRHWNILDVDNIGIKGLICDKCGEIIHPMHPDARWARHHAPKIDQPYEAFRIPQLMVPWIEWGDILDKMRKYSLSQFHNEVLGLSYDSGSRPLTRQNVVDNCNPEMQMNKEHLLELRRQILNQDIWMGIDWGTGEASSFTLLTLGTYINERFSVFFWHRFEGQETDPDTQIEIIKDLINLWKPRLIGTDYGGGFDRNDKLIRAFGTKRIVKYQYTAPSQKVRWEDKLGRFVVHRTEVMSDVFNAIKRCNVFAFPQWEIFDDPFGQDMLNIYSEYNERQRMLVYDKTPGTSDDSFHSLVLVFLVSILSHPRPDILRPRDAVRDEPDPYHQGEQQ